MSGNVAGFAVAASLVVLAVAAGGGTTSARRTLVLDAVATSVHTSGPGPDKVGHLQIARGILRGANGRAVGGFAYTCRWIAILPRDDARERCSGWGSTAEGRLTFAGLTHRAASTHTFAITGGSRAYRAADGTAVVRDLGETESLITATVVPRPGVKLRAAVVSLPAADERFRARADALCARTAARLDALPSFPYADFDPLHPDRKLLPEVGRFFTGPGDPRPALRALRVRMRDLGAPPAAGNRWGRVLAGLARETEVRDEQDSAALDSNATTFVRSVGDAAEAFRQTAIATALFGVPPCSL